MGIPRPDGRAAAFVLPWPFAPGKNDGQELRKRVTSGAPLRPPPPPRVLLSCRGKTDQGAHRLPVPRRRQGDLRSLSEKGR